MATKDVPQSVLDFIADLIKREGGYSDDPNDAGGATRWGITEAVARENGYTGAMSKLPKSKAVEIYLQKYYYGPNLHLIAEHSPLIAERVLDAGVNTGQHRASLWLQRCLNVFNNQGSYYSDLLADGIVGPNTAKALKALIEKRGEEGEQVLIAAFNALLGAHYIRISETRPANEKFTYGWFRGRILPFK